MNDCVTSPPPRPPSCFYPTFIEAKCCTRQTDYVFRLEENHKPQHPLHSSHIRPKTHQNYTHCQRYQKKAKKKKNIQQ